MARDDWRRYAAPAAFLLAATIEQLNPNVKSTSLFIGEKIRLR